MTRQDELNEAWCKYIGKCSTEIIQALAFALRWCDEHPNWEAIVKRLQEEITNDLRQDRWISVEDELPKEYEDVLVYGTIVSGKEIGVDSICPVLEKGCPSEWRVFSEVTHWMPLPSAEHLNKK